MLRKRTFISWALTGASAAAFVVGASAAVSLPGAAWLQDPPTQQDPPDPPTGRGGRQGGAAQAPRPYAQVIPSTAKTDEGIFKVHRVPAGQNETVFYEIPQSQLGKDFLWNTRIKRAPGVGLGGQNVGSRVVRWMTRGDRVLLLNIDYSIIADPDDPVAQAVADANYPSIIRVFPVAAYAPNQDPVIDVTSLITGDTPEFSARGRLGARGAPDANRSFLEAVESYPENINVEVTQTYSAGGAEGGGRGGGGGGGMRGPSGTVVITHSMVKLPETPMMPRMFDQRVGYTTEQLIDYGTEEHRSVQKRYIMRYRLEKRDANAAVSEPVKPITFWIDPGTPAKWVPFVKRGIESWQPAFEAAGFRGGIVAREVTPSDTEWRAEDARHSVVRWLPSSEETSWTLQDPRSGEILSATVLVYPNVQQFSQSWYFVQAGAVDPRAQQLPLPDAVMGEIIRYQVAHQIGHALGFPHNLKASSAYTVEQIRNPQHVKQMGFTSSVMDDAGFHYVAQPEDRIDPADLIPKVGPYDVFAVSWGYKPIASARSADAEKATLDQWAREQDAKPYLRFSTEGATAADPGDNADAVGDADAVAATTLGLKNLERVAAMMLKATSTKVGDPWNDLEEVYGRLVTQWGNEMSHVVKVIGGVESQQTHIGQQGPRFKVVPRARQVAALQFLVNNAFATPEFMIQPDILRRIQPVGVVERIRAAHAAILGALLQSQRLDRMTEQATLEPTLAYPPLQLLTDLRTGVWSELARPGTSISIYRRNLQRAYLDTMDQRLNGPGNSAEVRALAKGELRALDQQLERALTGTGMDENTRRHLSDARDEIKTILDPRVPRTAPEPAAAGGRGGRGGLGSAGGPGL
jgi:hypothetical protein